MKKGLYYLLLVICMMGMFCGCKKEDEPLKVYAVRSEALYTTAIDAYMKEHSEENIQVTSFDSYEDMETQLKTELMSGAGPDVLLFNSFYNSEDMYKLCTGNSLLALDEQVRSLTRDEYFEEILDAGVMNGHQYFVPLSWNVLQVYSSEKAIDGKEYDEPYTAIVEEAAALAAEDNYGLSSLQIGRADVVQLFVEASGELLVDPKTGELIVEKEKLQRTAEYVKVFYDNMDKMRSITTKYRNDFAGAVSHLTFLIEDYPFMSNFRFYETLYPQYVSSDMQVMFYEQYEGGMTAQIIQYGAVNANTKCADKAWDFLRCLLDDASVEMNFSKYDEQTIYYAPVNKKVYEECVKQLETEKGPGPNRKVGPLSEESGEMLLNLPSQITLGVIPNAALGTLVQECLAPYLSGTDSFDHCYDELLQQLKLYLNE